MWSEEIIEKTGSEIQQNEQNQLEDIEGEESSNNLTPILTPTASITATNEQYTHDLWTQHFLEEDRILQQQLEHNLQSQNQKVENASDLPVLVEGEEAIGFHPNHFNTNNMIGIANPYEYRSTSNSHSSAGSSYNDELSTTSSNHYFNPSLFNPSTTNSDSIENEIGSPPPSYKYEWATSSSQMFYPSQDQLPLPLLPSPPLAPVLSPTITTSPSTTSFPLLSLSTETGSSEESSSTPVQETSQGSSTSTSTSTSTTRNNNLVKSKAVMPYRTGVTPFITKLYWLLNNPKDYKNCIKWSNDGKFFLVNLLNQQFLKEVLPQLFLHKNIASFLRQLQLYEFVRLSTGEVQVDLQNTSTSSSEASTSTSTSNSTSTSSSNSTIDHDSDWRFFSHVNFKANSEDNLTLLHPKQSKARIATRDNNQKLAAGKASKKKD